MTFKNLDFSNVKGNIGRFFVGDRVEYVGKDRGGPIKGCKGRIVWIDPNNSRSIESDTRGEQLYVVEFDEPHGETYTYDDEEDGSPHTAEDRGWACADSMLELEGGG